MQRFPVVLELMQTGALHLSAIVTLHPHLNEDNHRELLALAEGKSQRQLERLLAARNPRPDVADSVRRLPRPAAAAPSSLAPTLNVSADAVPDGDGAELHGEAPRPAPSSALPASPPSSPSPPSPPLGGAAAPALARVQALSADRYSVKFTASEALIAKIDQARALLGHQLPDGDLAAILERALDALIAERMKKKFAVTPRRRLVPRVSTRAARGDARYVPAAVRRVVSERDAYRCSYVDEAGHRSAEGERRGRDRRQPQAPLPAAQPGTRPPRARRRARGARHRDSPRGEPTPPSRGSSRGAAMTVRGIGLAVGRRGRHGASAIGAARSACRSPAKPMRVAAARRWRRRVGKCIDQTESNSGQTAPEAGADHVAERAEASFDDAAAAARIQAPWPDAWWHREIAVREARIEALRRRLEVADERRDEQPEDVEGRLERELELEEESLGVAGLAVGLPLLVIGRKKVIGAQPTAALSVGPGEVGVRGSF